MAVLKPSAVIDALKTVRHPGREGDIASLGLIHDLEVLEGTTRFGLDLSTVEESERKALVTRAHAVVKDLDGTGEVVVTPILPVDPASGKSEDILKGVKNVVAVASGKGGVGKSTVAANLALALKSAGATVGLLDADIYGPSMPTMFKVTQPLQGAPDGRIRPIEAQGVHLMSIGFLAGEGLPMIWRGPMVSNMLQQMLGQVAWPALDTLVVDLPPGTGDAQLTLCQSVSLTGAVIVTTPQDISLIDARRGLEMFRKLNVPVLGLVENMAGFTCAHCNEVTHIFRQGGGDRIARQLDVPLLGSIPLDPEVVMSGDEGVPIVSRNPEAPGARAFMAVAEAMAERLGMVNSEKSGKPGGDLNLTW